MYIDEKLKFIESTVYHELGHVLGYVISNKKENTSLGKIKVLKIGLNENLVTPKKSYYHIEKDIILETSRLWEATSKVERTIAWFIEVLMGCTMQTIIEGTKFTSCFQQKKTFDGSLDYKNISDLRLVSSFKWNIQEIFDLQQDLEILLKREKIVLSIKPKVDEILEKIKYQKEHQINFSTSEIELLEDEFKVLVSKKFHEGYLHIIENYKQLFTQQQDLKVELNFSSNNSNVIQYRSGVEFNFKMGKADTTFKGKIRFIHKDVVQSGESVVAFILIEKPEIKSNLKRRTKFEFLDNSICIGNGAIMDIYYD